MEQSIYFSTSFGCIVASNLKFYNENTCACGSLNRKLKQNNHFLETRNNLQEFMLTYMLKTDVLISEIKAWESRKFDRSL